MNQTELTLIAQGGSFIAFFAALTAGYLMLKLRKKFQNGILASGFTTTSIGILLLAGAILFDFALSFVSESGLLHFSLFVLKQAFFIAGTYGIIIGCKKIGDNLEALTL